MSVQDAPLLVLLEVFDGQKSFDKWVSHFENVSTVNGWNDDALVESQAYGKSTNGICSISS